MAFVPGESSAVSGETMLAMHMALLKVRIAEETLAERYKEQEMRTPAHFGSGQEGVAVGVCQALRQDDVVFSHHRCHNHFLAKGGSVFELAAELYGRVSGCSQGRGGSVHLSSPDHGLIATSAILGEMPAVATGAALAFKMDKVDRVAATFFGDGSMDEGALYEAFNYACIARLPVLFVCENNLYATESPLSVRCAPQSEFCDRARSFGMDAKKVDGNDVVAVYDATRAAVAALRRGEGPFFLECMTYRWREHVGPHFDFDLGRTYRSRDEVEQWMAVCPVRRSEANLLELNLASRETLDQWRDQVQREVDETVEKARNEPWPEVSTLFDNI